MAYEEQVWVDKVSDVTAERMNHMEKGITEASKTGGISTGSVIGWTKDEIPEGFEEIDSSLLPATGGVEVGTIVDWEDETIPEGWEQVSNVVWENSDITQSFAEQTMTLNDDYSRIDVIFARSTSSTNEISQTIYPTGIMTLAIGLYDSKIVLRQVQYNGTSKRLTIYSGVKYATYGTATSDNTIMIPYRIIGYKKKIKKVAVTEIPEINGSIVDGTNIDDKTTNTYSANIIDGEVLYDNSSGSNASITLSDTPTNYKYLDIFFKENGTRKSSMRIIPSNNSMYPIMTITPQSTHAYWKIAQYTLLNDTKQLRLDLGIEMYSHGSGNTVTEGNKIYITKVVGYKY